MSVETPGCERTQVQRYHWHDMSIDNLLARKAELGQSVSLVVPARNEAATVGHVVSKVRRALMETVSLVDEIVVMDSDSGDRTGVIAHEAGAIVHRVADVRPDLGWYPGKGEAMWKSQFVTTGDLVVFMDADLLDWDTHFIPGLLGPLLTDPRVQLVKGFYERPFRDESGERRYEGGRVTELVARPLIATSFPELSSLVQPLAGEWAIRRNTLATLGVPCGYGVEFAALVDVVRSEGIEALAQVDLGVRAHRHQSLLDLGGMATQIMSVALERLGAPLPVAPTLQQFVREDGAMQPHARAVDITQRPPYVEVLEEA